MNHKLIAACSLALACAACRTAPSHSETPASNAALPGQATPASTAQTAAPNAAAQSTSPNAANANAATAGSGVGAQPASTTPDASSPSTGNPSTGNSGATAEATAPEDEPMKLADLEASCAGKDPCMPPAAVAERLCKRIDPDFALAMFRKGTPWKRVYTRRAFEAWYAAKGRTRPRQLRNAEELIVLVDRTNTGSGPKVSGFSNYDVYRWDGSCVSIMADEVTDLRPSTPDLATIPWRRLDDKIQDQLLSLKRISFRNDRRKKRCKSAGRGSDKCKAATHDLSRIIAEHLRNGGTIPLPKRLP